VADKLLCPKCGEHGEKVATLSLDKDGMALGEFRDGYCLWCQEFISDLRVKVSADTNKCRRSVPESP
jgi:hypothetical protein